MTTKYILRQDVDPTSQEPVDKGFLFCLTDSLGASSTNPSVPSYLWLSQTSLKGKEMVEHILSKFRTRMSIYSDEVGYTIYDKISDPEYDIGHNNNWTRVGISYSIGNISSLLSTMYFVNFRGTEGGLLNGIIDPMNEGNDGDFYINTVTSEIFGPKGGLTSGVWPTPGTSLTGQAGPPGIDWKGSWISMSYVENDVVEYMGSSYICTSDANSTQGPPNASYWDILADKGADGADGADGAVGPQGPIGPKGMDWKGSWTSGPYVENDTVEYMGSTYINILDTTSNQDPSNGTYWQIIAEMGSTGPQGIQGDPGPPGSNGSNGMNGLSAYQIWINEGNVGAEPAFLMDLEGRSAYQIWIDQGNVGSVQDFIDSLEGPPGTNGTNGTIIHSGSVNPNTNQVASPGDYYINTSTGILFGPKTILGVNNNWTGAIQTDLNGSDGATGPIGPMGNPGMVWKGEWMNGDPYIIDDVVFYEGGSYINIQGTSTQNPINDSFWEPVTTGVIWKGSWVSGGYFKNDIVYYQGSAYICILDTTSAQDPTNGTYWNLLAQKGSDGALSAQCFVFDYSDDINATDPGTGSVKFDSLSVNTATEVYIYETDSSSNSIENFITAIGSGTSNILGQMKVTLISDPNIWVLWSINSIVDNTTWFTIDVTYLGGDTGVIFNDTDEVGICFARTGDKGDTGPAGPQGIQGVQGNPGSDGNTVLYGTVDPTTEGTDGDFYINISTNEIFGPKGVPTPGSWPSGTSITGPQGIQGNPGSDGNTVLYGTVDPTTEGTDGDFYINTSTNEIFGPKGVPTPGSWPSGTSITGPQGIQGNPGSDGNTVLYGTVDPTTEGTDGDFYINTSTNEIFGPKGVPTPGSWPAGASITGPQGIQGIQGVQGIQGTKGMNWQGYWSNGTSYVIDDVIFSGGSTYICIQGHTGQEPPNGTYWDLVATGLNWQGSYAGAVNYNMFDVVEFNGSSFISIQETTGTQDPTNGSYWEVMAKGAYQVWLDLGNTGTEQDFLDALVNPSNPTIIALQNQININTVESLLQSSYQFRYMEDTSDDDTGFHVIGATTSSNANSVPLGQGRDSNSHIGYLADSNMRLKTFIVTIRGAATGSGTTPPLSPSSATITLSLKLHTWNANDTTPQSFSIPIPLLAVGSLYDPITGLPKSPQFSIGTNDASQAMANDINYAVDVNTIGGFPNIDVLRGVMFGLEFVTSGPSGNNTFAAIDNTHIKLIFKSL